MKEVVTFQTQYDTQADESAARVDLKERLIADVGLADATCSLLATLQSAMYQRRYGFIDIPQNVHDHREQLAPLAESYGMIFVPHWKYVGKFQLQLESGMVQPDPVPYPTKQEHCVQNLAIQAEKAWQMPSIKSQFDREAELKGFAQAAADQMEKACGIRNM